jgi:hypothetical protein
MAVTAVFQFTATIESNSVFIWSMTNAHPPFNSNLSERARPKHLVEWQAVPILVRGDIDSPGIQNAKAGIKVSEVMVIQEGDTSLTHRVQLTCHDVGNSTRPSHFVLTYALYAIFTDV